MSDAVVSNTAEKRPNANNVSPEEDHEEGTSSNKRAKLDPRITNFRSWSANADDNTATIYTLKCVFGDPNKPLPSSLKTAKVDVIKQLLQKRGVSNTGKKKELLERLQKDLPYVNLEIDSRECLQRLINAMLYHFQWDNTHLFECTMPRRGSLTDGTDRLVYQAFGLDMGMAIRMGNVSANPHDHDQHMRRHIERKLQGAGLTWADVQRAVDNPDALGPLRKVQGAGFAPFVDGNRWDDEERPQGGHFSLEADLALEAGDTLKVNYDFGHTSTFTIQVISVDPNKPVLPEVTLGYQNETRVKLLGSGNGRATSQYGA